MRVLLVDDDRDLAVRISAVLHAENFAVDVASKDQDGQHLGKSESYGAAILGLGWLQVEGAAIRRA